MAQKRGNRLRTPEEVRAEFVRRGLGVSQWARQNNVQAHVVHDVLAGKSKGRRGEAHKVAVLLGLKDGVVEDRQAA